MVRVLAMAGAWQASAGAAAQGLIIEDDGDMGALPSPKALVTPTAPEPTTAWRRAPSKYWAEAGFSLTDAAIRGSHGVQATTGIQWRPNGRWVVQLAGRLDGLVQTGEPHLDALRLDYAESFLRFRGERLRVTLGPQVIPWGRIDEVAPTDRLSVLDLTRFMLDDLEDRRRAVTALRIEGFVSDFKADLVWIPRFRPAELPDQESLWYPVDRRRGAVLGIPSDPVLTGLVQGGTFAEAPEDNDHQVGLRLSRAGRELDAALTVQYARQSAPYFELSPTVRGAVLAGAEPRAAAASGPETTFQARYPKGWLIGGDLGLAALGATWRFEAAYVSDLPATTQDLRYVTKRGVDWGIGTEFFPGDGETRITLQVLGHHLLDAGEVVDWQRTYAATGEIESTFDRARWRATLRFWAGLNQDSVYLNPSLAFLGWAPHELYLAVHGFSGEDGTAGGFYEDNDLLVLGWRATFR